MDLSRPEPTGTPVNTVLNEARKVLDDPEGSEMVLISATLFERLIRSSGLHLRITYGNPVRNVVTYRVPSVYADAEAEVAPTG